MLKAISFVFTEDYTLSMLLEFSFSNFRSFKESATLDMSPANLTSNTSFKNVDEENLNACSETGLKTLKVAAIYGSNASGKSNIIKALRFMKSLVLNSSREGQANDIIRTEPFLLDISSKNLESGFEVTMIVDGTKYRYGFEVNQHEVVSEWLFYVPSIRETKIFERVKSQFKYNSKYAKSFDDVESKTRKNALFISVLSQFNNTLAMKIVDWFSKINFHSADIPNNISDPSRLVFANPEIRRHLNDILNAFDIELSGIKYEEINFQSSEYTKNLPKPIKDFLADSGSLRGAILKTVHKVYSGDDYFNTVEFDLDSQESDGTKKLFSLLPTLVEGLGEGGVLIIDEMDARLHPKLTLGIIKLFNGVGNSRCSQLIFTTHDTNLLSKENFRRDQIWFVEKDKKGASCLYSLAEIQTRNDANYEKDYLNGRYGAIPFINSLKALDSHE